MRCDCCPLCPIAEDDVCLESEGEFGLEHADGTWGCKHPRNWAEKRSNEHDTMLGEMKGVSSAFLFIDKVENE